MENGRNSQIESILTSLDHVKPAEAPAYLYTRIKGRLQTHTEKPLGFWILRPVSAIVLLLVLLSMNAFLLMNDHQQENPELVTNVSDTEYSNAIAAEYRLQDNFTFYENGQELAGK